MTSQPCRPRNVPSTLAGPYRATSIRPVTTVGTANGRSIRAFITALPGKSYRTSTQAVAVPVTALISTITPAVANVSFNACQANGFATALANAEAPGSTASELRATSGSTTIRPRYESVTPRSNALRG